MFAYSTYISAYFCRGLSTFRHGMETPPYPASIGITPVITDDETEAVQAKSLAKVVLKVREVGLEGPSIGHLSPAPCLRQDHQYPNHPMQSVTKTLYIKTTVNPDTRQT